jgi:hypothetical protein
MVTGPERHRHGRRSSSWRPIDGYRRNQHPAASSRHCYGPLVLSSLETVTIRSHAYSYLPRQWRMMRASSPNRHPTVHPVRPDACWQAQGMIRGAPGTEVIMRAQPIDNPPPAQPASSSTADHLHLPEHQPRAVAANALGSKVTMTKQYAGLADAKDGPLKPGLCVLLRARHSQQLHSTPVTRITDDCSPHHTLCRGCRHPHQDKPLGQAIRSEGQQRQDVVVPRRGSGSCL